MTSRLTMLVLVLVLVPLRSGAQGRRAPTPADFELAGKWTLPYQITTPAGIAELSNIRGLAIAVSGSTVKMLTAVPKPGQIQVTTIFRFTVPATGTAVTTAEVLGTPGLIPGGEIWGLHYEDPGVLYYNTQNNYDATTTQQKTVCRSAISGATITPDACWNLQTAAGAAVGDKQTQGCVVRNPTWFVDQYVPGQTLSAGCGFYFSSAINGQASKGASFWTFTPPATTDPIARVGVRLLGNDFTNKDPALWWRRPGSYTLGCDPANPIPQLERSTDAPCVTANTVFAGDRAVDPSSGLGWIVWTDFGWQACDWVDDDVSISGVVCIPILSTGHVYYKDATLKAEGTRYYWAIVDWHDLAAVAQGTKRAGEVQPMWTPLDLPGVPMSGWRDQPSRMVVGVTWSKANRTLYILVRQALPMAINGVTQKVATLFAYRLMPTAPALPVAPFGLEVVT